MMIHPGNALPECRQQNRSNDTPIVNQQYLNQKWEFSHEPTYNLKAKKQGYPTHIFSYLLLFYFWSYRPNNINRMIIGSVLLLTVYDV